MTEEAIMTEETTNEMPAPVKRKRGLRRSGAFKAFMVLTNTIAVIGAAGGVILTAVFAENGMYTEPRENIGKSEIENMCQSNIWQVSENWQNIRNCTENPDTVPQGYIEQLQQKLKDDYAPSRTNFEFVIRDPEDAVVFECFTNGSYQYTWTEPFYSTTYETTHQRMTAAEWSVFDIPDNADVSAQEVWITEPVMPSVTEAENTAPPPADEYTGALEETTPPEEMLPLEEIPPLEETPPLEEVLPTANETEAAKQEVYTPEYHEVLYYDVTISVPHSELTHSITGYVREELTADDYYARNVKFFGMAYDYRYVPPIAGAAGVLIFLFSLGFLLWSAGWRRDAEEPAAGIFEKIPFDAFTCMLGAAGMILFQVLDDMVNTLDYYLELGLICSGVLLLWLIVLWWLVSTAVRIRTKTILRNNVIVILWKKFWNAAERGLAGMQGLPILWQVPLTAFGFFLLQMFATVLLAGGNGLGLGLIILLYTAAIIGICTVVLNMHLLEKGAEKIAGGDLNHQIPENKLFGAFKKHGQHLNSIGDGMNLAVSERMKSERFKTELIANVSHDIRTPLTSIINYTDLLSKLELEDAQAQEYIEVLTRQSARLRKLTEDVLEASKATTGTMKVEKEKMDLRVLLEQIQGEYAEKFEDADLKMVCTMPEQPLYISADGRLMWRVMDNLFGNVCKYAMRGTRVYLDAAAERGQITLTMRNISAVQLHISADMLMERFVQGDRSRNTEGSGLGLSIAQSLTALQGGTMTLHIDGDLFKAELTFPETAF